MQMPGYSCGSLCTAAGTPTRLLHGAGTSERRCGGTAIGADEVNSSVLWGTTDQNTYTIVTGVATPVLFGGSYLPPGETSFVHGSLRRLRLRAHCRAK